MPLIRKPDQIEASRNILPVMEHFYTIQGEGINAGQPAYFIRLAGCDVGCVWCDVKDSWNASIYPSVSVGELVTYALQHPTRICVITGGEPLMHNLDALTRQLQSEGFETNIETSGSHPLSGHWNWICLSPKKFKAPLPDIPPLANELKVVISNKSDFKWAEQYAEKVAKQCSS